MLKGEAHNGGTPPDYAMEMLMRFPTMPNFMERYLNFGERTAMQDMAEQRIMAEYWIKDYFLSQSLGVAVEGLVIGNYSISIYTGIRAQVAFMGLQKEEFDYNMSQTYKGLAYMNSRGAKAWYTDPSETINLFKSKNDVYNRYSNSIPIRSGDNIFFVTGHGNLPGFAQDGSGEGFEDFYADDPRDVKAFDFLLASKNRAYKKAIEKNDPFILCLLVCQSELMAQGLSLLHNNGIYMGARGFVMYGTDNNGNPSVNGVSSEQYKNLNDGALILYRNGKQLGQIKLPWNLK